MIRRMFKIPSHRKFQYDPRYYDPDKEDLERRITMAELDAKDKEEALNKRHKLRFQDRWKSAADDRNFYTRIHHQKSMMRIRFFIILNILLLLVIFAIYKFF
jgi:hypothetical protein